DIQNPEEDIVGKKLKNYEKGKKILISSKTVATIAVKLKKPAAVLVKKSAKKDDNEELETGGKNTEKDTE
ncbi:21713_t:CDS:2, partial [Gigaspora rosea]